MERKYPLPPSIGSMHLKTISSSSEPKIKGGLTWTDQQIDCRGDALGSRYVGCTQTSVSERPTPRERAHAPAMAGSYQKWGSPDIPKTYPAHKINQGEVMPRWNRIQQIDSQDWGRHATPAWYPHKMEVREILGHRRRGKNVLEYSNTWLRCPASTLRLERKSWGQALIICFQSYGHGFNKQSGASSPSLSGVS